ncbi:MAG: hypothetical protein OXJ52_08165 [Oligoflexia bacterium]|nr:hypothetical protein [Oligoflexia bacterium]
MGIHVALIDKSEIIHKMLLHCLYYYTVQAHRFDSLKEYLEKFHDKKPSLVFVDWDIKQGDQALIYTAKEQFHPVPFVLLYRQTAEKELSGLSKDQVPYRVKKPINPKEVRDVCAELIPELKDSVLHSFLKFPKSEEEKRQEQSQPAPSPLKQKETAENQEKTEDKTKSFIENLIEKTGLFKMPSPEEIESAEEFPDPNEDSSSSSLNPPTGQGFQTATGLTSAVSSSLSSKNKSATAKAPDSSKKSSPNLHSKVETVGTTLTDRTALTTKTIPQKLDSPMPKSKETSARKQKSVSSPEKPVNLEKATGKGFQTATGLTSAPSNLKSGAVIPEKQGSGSSQEIDSKAMKAGRFNKEDINIDENTQNDLAPMAIKSSPAAGKKPEQQSFGKKDLLQVFNKYKDSLEFQKLMEKTLAEYAQDAVAGVLKGDSVKSILQKPLEDFKESAQFKQLIEKEISQYVRAQLPLIIKSIVEKEIKKIIGD